MRPRLVLLLLALTGAHAEAQQVARSASPDQVAVTLYRDPGRAPDRRLDRWLNGVALISETRIFDLPAGNVELRFEGVAGGIIPQSAILSDLPGGVVERNQDAYLLSPASLIERSLGRRVHLRRTHPATGAVREHDAIVRSGAAGALVLQTAEGFEALRCSGLAETILYPDVPAGLSPKPILSVRARVARPVRARVTLSYLATGFDWQAQYVAHLSPDGVRLDLLAWLTLASTDETSFRNASTQAVAGRINRAHVQRLTPRGGPIRLGCWPEGTTSDVALKEEIVVTAARVSTLAAAPSPPPPPPPAMASVALEAQQEDVGDLKLYRIPEPVTLAANSNKQVAFLQRAGVGARLMYRHTASPDRSGWAQATRVLLLNNREADGLGVPLPAGRLLLFANGRERPLLLGEGVLTDRAVGEEAAVELGPAPAVRTQLVRLGGKGQGEFLLRATNDGQAPARLEVLLPFAQVRADAPVARRNGMALWQVTVPANGEAALRFQPADP